LSYVTYKRKGNFKGFLFVLGLLIIGAILVYTQHLVNILQEKSRESINFRVRVLEENINNEEMTGDFGFLLTEVIQGIDFPVIYTDAQMIPQFCINIDAAYDSLRVFTPEISSFLQKDIDDLDIENPPIPIFYKNIILGYYHYGVSPIIKKLRWLPYIEITAAILFILIGYVGFSQIKKSEQRYIWVGMAKETAHQLGTPLSSIQGWVELLKDNPQKMELALSEMEIDTKRLSKIALRFSQIGSVPTLKETNIVDIMENVVIYFRKRLPRLEKKITIKENYTISPVVKLNGELFEWVIENLLKNAIDAIESKGGVIEISLRDEDNNFISVDISDTGKGINTRDKTDIFKPGFSTKTRGWGLGLSLAKRIIEDYHGGRIIITETHIGKGSTFRILLKNA
jgi:signal transduction histidine kinase